MTPGSFRGRIAASLLALSAIVAACSGSDATTGPHVVAPASLEAAVVLPLTGAAGSTVGDAPTVVVKGADNSVLAGVKVTFDVQGGGSIANSSATTDANGRASTGPWILGSQMGNNVVVATVAGLSPVSFQVQVTAGAPSSIVVLPDNVGSATVGANITPGIRVLDRFGNSVANTVVTFLADAGTITRNTATTDDAGVAHVAWTLATTIGIQALHATVGTISSTITVAANAASATQLLKVTGDAQSGVVGGALSTMPSVKVTDAFGNVVAGTPVTFTVTEGNSVLIGATQSTNESGIATLGGWTLGTAAGRNTITASLATGANVAFTATGTPAQFTGLTITAGNAQSATAGSAVATNPAVRARDDFGNGIAGVNVKFTVTTGGGTVTGASVTTGSDGVAVLGSWILGTTAGQNAVTASTTGAFPVTITATGVAGVATQLVKSAGDAQSVQAGSAVPVSPAVTVLDKNGNAVAGAVVTFTVTAGGGTVTGSPRTSDANGRAAVTQWTIGSAGTNTLNASIANASVSFSATGTAPALTMTKVSGDNSSCSVGTQGCSFSVKVANALGAGVAGQTVVWTSGNQTLSTTTNTSGIATASNLVSQTSAGSYTQVATLSGTSQSLTFTYLTVAVSSPGFNIDVRFIGAVTQAQLAVFTAAAAKWQRVITGDIPDFNVPAGWIDAGACGSISDPVAHPALVGNVDDIVIYVELKYLDGLGTPASGNLLGQAYPCDVRPNNPMMPYVGVMQFDTTDLTTLANNGTLQDVITHEMGHVLGIGTLWQLNTQGLTGSFDLMSGAGSADPFFFGSSAKDYYGRVGGVITAGSGVPLENCLVGVPTGCGAGTRDSHWRESVFKNELMTGYVSRTSNPLSVVTIAALADQGYTVNYAAADAFSLATASGNMAMTAEGDSNTVNADGILLKEGAAPPLLHRIRR